MSKNGWFGLEKSAGVGFERPPGVISFSSPGVNWLFGNYGGIPRGYTAVFWGKPRGGKSVALWDAIANEQRRDPTSKVILFDTEMRTGLQQGGATSKNIDMSRVLIKQTNDPAEIFDFIEKDVPAAIDEGLNLPMIAIDSLSLIRGRKSLAAESISAFQIGDQAQTLQEGFKRILPVLRRKHVALLCTAQARAEMDPMQQMMRKTYKMDAAYGVKHLIEFFVQVDQVEAKSGKLYNEGLKDSNDNALLTGNRIRITMNESSAGGKGRQIETTLSYDKGFINIGDEVAKLGINLGVVSKPDGGRSVIYKDNKWNNYDALVKALDQEEDLRNKIMADVMEKTKNQE